MSGRQSGTWIARSVLATNGFGVTIWIREEF